MNHFFKTILLLFVQSGCSYPEDSNKKYSPPLIDFINFFTGSGTWQGYFDKDFIAVKMQ